MPKNTEVVVEPWKAKEIGTTEACNRLGVQEYKRRIKDLRTNEEIYKDRLAETNMTLSRIHAEKTYTIDELNVVFARIRDVLDKADVVELRTLMHTGEKSSIQSF